MLVKVATSAGIRCFVLASDTFLSGSGTLSSGRCWLFCGASITAIGSYRSLVYFTSAAVRFTAVTGHAQQLNV